MFYGSQDVEVWRLTPVTGTFSDPIYTFHHTAEEVTIQPFSSNQGMRNNQLFANVLAIMIVDSEEDMADGDELVYTKDASYGRVQVVESWDSSVMPHKEVYTSYSQWDRQNG
jgi:hypothetical protein